MTLAEAVVILNRFQHRECSEWCVSGDVVCGSDYYDILESFEAIAIAEKYVGESERRLDHHA